MNYAGFNFKGHDLSGNNLTLYEATRLEQNRVVLIRQGTLDDCISEEAQSTLILLPNSPAAKKYGIGFLNPGETYEPNKVVRLDALTVIAGCGSITPWEDFVRRVKLERLREKIYSFNSSLI